MSRQSPTRLTGRNHGGGAGLEDAYNSTTTSATHKEKVNMCVHLHVRDKIVTVECGAGTQKIKWLANVGVARYDDSFGRSLGAPRGIQKEGGTMCDPMLPINKALGNGQHCFVVLNDFVGQEQQQGGAASGGGGGSAAMASR